MAPQKTRPRLGFQALSAAAVLALSLTGCGLKTDDGQAKSGSGSSASASGDAAGTSAAPSSSPSSAAPSAKRSASPKPTARETTAPPAPADPKPTQPKPDANGMIRYVSEDRAFAFSYPAGWTVEEKSAALLLVRDENGEVQAALTAKPMGQDSIQVPRHQTLAAQRTPGAQAGAGLGVSGVGVASGVHQSKKPGTAVFAMGLLAPQDPASLVQFPTQFALPQEKALFGFQGEHDVKITGKLTEQKAAAIAQEYRATPQYAQLQRMMLSLTVDRDALHKRLEGLRR